MPKLKIYFPNLNGLRFIAAFLVIVHHIEEFKSLFHLDSYMGVVPFVGIIGKLGVVLFFVLSGFLITYLLLSEESNSTTIKVKNFYIRRILRIWPLYYLIIILGIFILPHVSFFSIPDISKDFVYAHLWVKLFLYVAFLPNLVLGLYGAIPYVAHTWSIGTEEQYYLVWPLFIKYFKKNRLVLMLSIILGYLAVEKLLYTPYTEFLPYRIIIRKFWSGFNIDCMAIGGIYAILLFNKSKILPWVLNQYLFYFTLIITSLLLLNGVYIPKIHYEFYAVLFGIIILNFAANNTIKVSLENKIFNYLGNISYGLYMYHPIAIVAALKISFMLQFSTNWFTYPFSVFITIAIAGFSYTYYEKIFLKFKNKFSDIYTEKQV